MEVSCKVCGCTVERARLTRHVICEECRLSVIEEHKKLSLMKNKMAKYKSTTIENTIAEAAARGISYGRLQAERRRGNG